MREITEERLAEIEADYRAEKASGRLDYHMFGGEPVRLCGTYIPDLTAAIRERDKRIAELEAKNKRIDAART